MELHQTRVIRTTVTAELAQLPLIHLDAPDKRWTSWATWFDEQGYDGPVRRGVKVNNYMIALQAAQDGAGMVLGWRRLVSPYLANGSLIAFEGFTIPAPASFFLSRNKQSGSNPDIDLLERWIISFAAGSSDEMNSTKS